MTVGRRVRAAVPAAVPAAVLVAGVVALVGASVWLAVHPLVADLAAQRARAWIAGRDGFSPYSTWWFSGFDLPTYSVWVPWLMSVTSVFVVGAVATVVAALAGSVLFLATRRPVVGAALFAVAMLTNLYSGRVTFAVGCALALVSLLFVVRRPTATSFVGAVVGAVLTATASPVAALFLVLASVVVGITRSGRTRWVAVACVVAAVAPLVVLAWLAPGAGYQPYAFVSAVLALSVSVGLVVAPLPREVRLGAAISCVAVLVCYFVHTPVGSNVSRLAMLAGVPIAAACLQVRPLLVALLVLAFAWWPVKQVTEDVLVARDLSTQAASYRPLAAQLGALPLLSSRRLEVVEPRSHWQAHYLLGHARLARGWNRQLDESLNPLFYGRAPLTATTYRRWLDNNAVAYVAMPRENIDFGSTDEQGLIAHGLPYLSLTWQNAYWSLYTVRLPAPVARGVVDDTAWTPNGVRLHAPSPGGAVVRLHWSPFLHASGDACVTRAGDWTRVYFYAAGVVVVQPRWTARGQTTPSCSRSP